MDYVSITITLKIFITYVTLILFTKNLHFQYAFSLFTQLVRQI